MEQTPDPYLLRCRECGAAVPDDSTFCYACGAICREECAPRGATREADPGFGPVSLEDIVRASLGGFANTVSSLILVWGVVSMVLSIISVQDIAVSGEGFAVSSAVPVVFLLSSGICATASSFLLRRRRQFIPCIMLCGVQQVTAVPGVNDMILGLLCLMIGFNMTFAVYRCRPVFHMRPTGTPGPYPFRRI